MPWCECGRQRVICETWVPGLEFRSLGSAASVLTAESSQHPQWLQFLYINEIHLLASYWGLASMPWSVLFFPYITLAFLSPCAVNWTCWADVLPRNYITALRHFFQFWVRVSYIPGLFQFKLTREGDLDFPILIHPPQVEITDVNLLNPVYTALWNVTQGSYMLDKHSLSWATSTD